MTSNYVPRPMQEYRQFGEAAGEAMRSNAERAARHNEARAREDAERATAVPTIADRLAAAQAHEQDAAEAYAAADRDDPDKDRLGAAWGRAVDDLNTLTASVTPGSTR